MFVLSSDVTGFHHSVLRDSETVCVRVSESETVSVLRDSETVCVLRDSECPQSQ